MIVAKKQKQPVIDEERELDKAYWELTGYKFNQKKRPPLLWLILLITAFAAAWYWGLPDWILEYFS